MERTLLTDEELSEQLIRILMRELGPVETARVVARLGRSRDMGDSVQRHREYAASVENDDEFFENLYHAFQQQSS